MGTKLWTEESYVTWVFYFVEGDDTKRRIMVARRYLSDHATFPIRKTPPSVLEWITKHEDIAVSRRLAGERPEAWPIFRGTLSAEVEAIVMRELTARRKAKKDKR